MIQIRTSPDGTRTISLARCLLDVAVSVTGENERDAAFSLARRLSLDALATLERIAMNVSHEAAVALLSRYSRPAPAAGNAHPDIALGCPVAA